VKPVRISAPAQEDFREILDWYADRDSRVALRFVSEARRSLTLIEQFPNIGSRVPDVDDRSVREIEIQQFPYRIIFVDLGDHLQVAAFAHKHRGPKYLLDRLRKFVR
jgi:plasmid stabilization system protein ParE